MTNRIDNLAPHGAQGSVGKKGPVGTVRDMRDLFSTILWHISVAVKDIKRTVHSYIKYRKEVRHDSN
jgi:hypothetical protein